MTSDPAYEASSKAKRQVEGGNPQGAVDTLEDYLRTDPHNNKLRLQLAQIIIYELEDMEYGMMQLDAILDIDPEYVDALIAKVTILAENKRNNKETDELFLSMPMTEFRLSGGGRLAPLASAPSLPIGRVDIYVEILAAIIAFLSVNCFHVIPSDESSSMVGLLIFHTSP